MMQVSISHKNALGTPSTGKENYSHSLVFTASELTDLFRLCGRKVVAQRDVQAEFNFHRLQQGRQHPCVWAPASAEKALHHRGGGLAKPLWQRTLSGVGISAPVSPFQ